MLKKYFSYIRVSTQRQGQHGTSLAEQQASIERFAQRGDFTIVKCFEERETAARQGRPVFLDMLKQLKRGAANGVIIHKIDRSARNLRDWADLGNLLDSGVELHFASESVDLNSRGGRLSADIQAVVASDFIRNLREESKKGIYGRIKQGLFPFKAPIGYLDRGKGQPKAIDPVAGPLVRRAFELYATGNWSLITLPDKLYEIGFRNRSGGKITTNGLFKMLHNPFYGGIVGIATMRQTFQGQHRPIIDRRLFDQVQAILTGRNVPKVTVHNFTFRRMVRCGECQSTVIGELQKGRVYYRCHTRSCSFKSVREDEIENAVGLCLKKLQIGPAEFDMIAREAERLFRNWKV
ncbi:MAG: recombinase family protein, partial [Acidobacteriota bacterium]